MNKLAHSNIDIFRNTILDRTKILQLKIVNTKMARRWSSRNGSRGLVGSTFGDAANAAAAAVLISFRAGLRDVARKRGISHHNL
jgi:hypothetical protein